MNFPPNEDRPYDVVIIGGALSGAATALILKREQPNLRVLILEKSTALGRRVGEATIELSTYFLCRVLGLTQFLNETQLTKHGLRFWFTNARTKELDECSEIGGRYWSRVPAYLVDRATLDEEVLRRAGAGGAELWRPATVQNIELQPGGEQVVTVKYQDQSRSVRTRWVVDASGVAALLARQQGWWRPNHAHPTTAVWARWRGVKDWESVELARKFPAWSAACYGQRGSATNHLMGDGWWAWWIPLKGGEVSVGVTFDQRRVQWPEGGSPGQRLKDFLQQHPVGRELMADAHWVEGDVHWRKNLPFHSTTFAGDGFSLVGDAAGFLDPFYSPGLDWISFTVTATTELILAQQRGEPLAPRIARHNHDFGQSYARWFEAIYQDKYEYLGEFDLMRLAFLLDLGLYYLGVASQPFKRGPSALVEPYFSTPPSTPFYFWMRTYNRRFAQIARSRRARGTLGRANDRRRFMFQGYTFAAASVGPILRATARWGLLEITEGWRSWGQKAPLSDSEKTTPAVASAAQV